MEAEVYFRRRRGQRLEPRDERGQVPRVGAITFARVHYASGEVRVLALQDIQNSSAAGQIAQLFEPELIALGNGWISFRGFESVDMDGKPASYLQEWRCCLKTK